MPLTISVVICAHNEAQWLGACLHSVLAQTRPADEVLVVNNASTDPTRAAAAGIRGVRVVDEPRKGLVIARETGRHRSSGSVLAYLDADCRAPLRWLERVERRFALDADLVALSGPYRFYAANSDFHKPRHLYSWKTLLKSDKNGPAIKAALRRNVDVALTLPQGRLARVRDRRRESQSADAGVGARFLPATTAVAARLPVVLSTVASELRVDSELCAIASATSRTNRTNGIISPRAAAPIGFAGSSEATHDAKDCACPLVVTSPAASAAPAGRVGLAPSGSSAKTAGATGTMTITIVTRRRRNVISARAPISPSAFTSAIDAVPVMMSDTTSGITVMRMALIQSVPSGATPSAKRNA